LELVDLDLKLIIPDPDPANYSGSILGDRDLGGVGGSQEGWQGVKMGGMQCCGSEIIFPGSDQIFRYGGERKF